MLAGRCDVLVATIRPILERHWSARADGDVASPGNARSSSSGAAVGSAGPGSSLLSDLRELSVRAHGAELDWTVVRQAALAARDEELLDVAAIGLDEARRVGRWAKTRIKEAVPQTVASAD
jgi:hypothetical protein